MPLVVAVEPDPEQASKVTSIVGEHADVELVLRESAEAVLLQLQQRVPDLILTSALIPPGDEARIIDALRQLGVRAAHLQTLTIPLLGAVDASGRRSGLFGAFRQKPKRTDFTGCAPEVFASQVREYLDLAFAERRRLDIVAPVSPVPPASAGGSQPEGTAGADRAADDDLVANEPPEAHLFTTRRG